MRPLRAPVVHPVRDSLGAQAVGHPPGAVDVLPLAVTGGEQNEPLPEPVEAAVESDDRLDGEQKKAILAVYRSMLRRGQGPE